MKCVRFRCFPGILSYASGIVPFVWCLVAMQHPGSLGGGLPVYFVCGCPCPLSDSWSTCECNAKSSGARLSLGKAVRQFIPWTAWRGVADRALPFVPSSLIGVVASTCVRVLSAATMVVVNFCRGARRRRRQGRQCGAYTDQERGNFRPSMGAAGVRQGWQLGRVRNVVEYMYVVNASHALTGTLVRFALEDCYRGTTGKAALNNDCRSCRALS